jgi:hypothetical protein
MMIYTRQSTNEKPIIDLKQEDLVRDSLLAREIEAVDVLVINETPPSDERA